MNASELDLLVATYDLNQHPFYQAWRAGTLPRAALAAYAAGYAPFIASVEDGWRTLGEADHAAEEHEHALLWERFRDALGSSGATEGCKETAALTALARGAFAESASAIGALYAFEAQQPSTARSKLEGLRAHYAVGQDAEAYFDRHADDYGERELLRKRLDTLDVDGRARAHAACEATCRAMWAALDGVLATSGADLACA
jgi:pyrroloquinoline-quinone synthase